MAYLSVTWLAFIFCEIDLINLSSMYKMTLLLVSLAIFLIKSNSRVIVLIMVQSLYTLMFFTNQFFLYIVAPTKAAPSYANFLSQETISNAMTYILMGSILVSIGFLTGARMVASKKKRMKHLKMLPFSPDKTLLVLILSLVITYIYAFVLRFANVNLVRTIGLPSAIMGYLTLFINDSVILLILYVVFAQKWEFIGAGLKKGMIAVVFMLIFLSFASGSRSGFVRPVIYLFFALFALKGDFRFSKELIALVTLAIVASFVMFPFVTYIKGAWFEGLNLSDTSVFYGLLRSQAENLAYEPWSFLYNAINRLNGLAPITGILTIPYEYFGEVITVSGQIKYLINKLLPFANPFPEAISTAQLFKVILFNQTYLHITEHFHTQAYTLWGLTYAHFGWWGGLGAAYIIAFAIGAIYQKVTETKSVYNLFLRTWVIVFTYGSFRGFGFDEQISTHYMFLASGIGYTVLMRFIDKKKHVVSMKETQSRKLLPNQRL